MLNGLRNLFRISVTARTTSRFPVHLVPVHRWTRICPMLLCLLIGVACCQVPSLTASRGSQYRASKLWFLSKYALNFMLPSQTWLFSLFLIQGLTQFPSSWQTSLSYQ